MNVHLPHPPFDAELRPPGSATKGLSGTVLKEMQAMFDGVADKVVLLDRDGTILLVNARWQREVELLGLWDFQVGCSYPDAMIALIAAGDTRIGTLLNAFREIAAGNRQRFRCVYCGSGVLSGHDYKILMSALRVAEIDCVLISSQDLTEINTLKRQRRRAGTQVLKAQEEERRRIAREIHDSTAQLLVALQLNLMNLRTKTGPEAEGLIADCRQAIGDIHQEIRSLSFMAHPPSLSPNDLGGTLERLTDGVASRTGLDVHLQISDVGDASASVEAAIYRVVQEGLSNIHRHAGASHAQVRLIGTKRCLHLAISDDGSGFELRRGAKRAAMGVGIFGMEERVRELGGRFSIRRLDQGTLLTASFPRRKSL